MKQGRDDMGRDAAGRLGRWLAACALVLGTAAHAAPAPGRCLQYQIVAQNTTAASLGSVVISDNIPGATTLHVTCAAPATSAGTISGPSTDGATGTLSVNVGTMTTGASVTFSFCVRIDP